MTNETKTNNVPAQETIKEGCGDITVKDVGLFRAVPLANCFPRSLEKDELERWIAELGTMPVALMAVRQMLVGWRAHFREVYKTAVKNNRPDPLEDATKAALKWTPSDEVRVSKKRAGWQTAYESFIVAGLDEEAAARAADAVIAKLK